MVLSKQKVRVLPERKRSGSGLGDRGPRTVVGLRPLEGRSLRNDGGESFAMARAISTERRREVCDGLTEGGESLGTS